MAAGPAVKVAHLGAQAGLGHYANFFGIRIFRDLGVVGVNVLAVARGIEQVTECFAIGTYAVAYRGTIFEHAHRIAGGRNLINLDIFLTGLEILLTDLHRQAAFVGDRKTRSDLNR